MNAERYLTTLRPFRRPFEEIDSRVLGFVTVGALVLALVIALAINSVGIGEDRYEAEFAQAAGIRAGDGITIAGISVGSVSDVRLAGDRVVVGMRIDENVPLGADTKASIKLTTLLGARYIELAPAGAGEIPAHRIELANTVVPYDLQTALENATVTFEEVDTTQLGESLVTLSTQLQGVPTVLPQVLTNVHTLATIVGGRRDELGSLLAGIRQLAALVHQQQSGLGIIVDQGRELLTQITARRQAIETLLAATTQLVDQLHVLVVDDSPALTEMVNSLNALLDSLSRHDDLLRNILEILPVPVRNFVNATGTSNEIDFSAPAGVLMDSWMCAISGRATAANLPPYFQDCR
ncbi:MCE family protein [Nocardia arizonensis]|uniref:MCE family protein n=1 Tax=Nocardia arizonensis TaxID=1141647 RepID=UPI0009EBF9BC|nr:MCE family protein [Nocardia arizonensis]